MPPPGPRPADRRPPGPERSLAALVERARALVDAPTDVARRRVILGVTGPPGAGKSTLAQRLVDALGDGAAPAPAVLVPMDGFHLANVELDRLGRRDRKGAIDTFDAAGYLSLLRRLRTQAAQHEDAVVYAPSFLRTLDEPVAGAIAVPRDATFVVTEGNYLLARREPWTAVRRLLDEVWYYDPPEPERLSRLVARHERFGRTHAEAVAWALGSDQANAELVARTRGDADLVVDPVDDHLPDHLPVAESQ